MNGVIYCRVSSKEQTEGTSLESQEVSCREYAQSREIEIVQTFIERGESAKFADRTALLELIEFVRTAKGRIQVLLVWKVDRFARNVTDHFNVKAMLLKFGVRIVSVTEPIDTNPEGKLMETILAGFAQFDNDIRAIRTVQGMKKKIQEGIFPWRPPLGYRTPARATEKKTLPDVPDQPIFGLLQKAWREFASGAYSKAEIRRLMASWGIVTGRGTPLSAQVIDWFFRNRFYAGVLVDPWSLAEYPGKHVPMVGEADFSRVQQIVAKRNRSIPHQKVRPEFPLRGVVRCKNCGRHLTGSLSRGRSGRYPYYHCGNRQCPQRGKTYPTERIQTTFQEFLASVSPKPEILAKIRDAVLLVAEERRGQCKARKSSREATLRALSKQTDEIIRMRAQGLISDEEFSRHKADLEARRVGNQAELAEDRVAPDTLRKDMDEIMAPLGDLRGAWEMLAGNQCRRFQQLLLPAGFVNENVGTAALGCLFGLSRALLTRESNEVPLIRKSWNQIVQEIRAFAELFREVHISEQSQEDAVRKDAYDWTPLDKMEPQRVM